MKALGGLLVLALMTAFSCGGVQEPGGAGGGSAAVGGGFAAGGGSATGALSGTYACDLQVAGTHSCNEYAWSGGVYTTSAWAQGCTGSGGSATSACSRSGAVLGCKVTRTSGAVSVSSTTWYYSGTRSTYETACAASGGTTVSP
jgi:hypothetical protein